MRTWLQMFQQMRIYLFPGLIAPLIIGIMLAWQQGAVLNWFYVTLALLLNLVTFGLLHRYLIGPDQRYKNSWYSIILVWLAGSLFVISAYALQSGHISGTTLLASLQSGSMRPFFTMHTSYPPRI
ncbi:hypothetical protein [Dictyobacter kobayashii]|uniref:Uncharacterized protein n=1 Tax=Dictyobacter kobayashii TaxID=2014872 RepID=A0A402ABW2_9CHLR|nr:hypothetical protein [Dictyobacter kobayashii]GCE16568.1 hypothetical protein KDK_03680 [Dictyobacter kobayashii]